MHHLWFFGFRTPPVIRFPRSAYPTGPDFHVAVAMARLVTTAGGYQSFALPEVPKELSSEGCLGGSI